MITHILLSLAVLAPIAIENVKVEVGDGTILKRTTVVFEDGKIIAVGEHSADTAQKIDGRNKVLTPGFLEVESQLGLIEVDLEKATQDFTFKSVDGLQPAFRAADGFNPFSAHVPVNREEGVTSAIISPTGGLISGTGSWVPLLANIESIPSADKPIAMFATVGHDAFQTAGEARGGVWLKLRQLFEDVRFYQKNQAAIQRGQSRPLLVSPIHLEAMVPVLAGKIPLVMRVHRASDIIAAIEFSRREQIKIIISGGAEAHVVADYLAVDRIPVIIHQSIQSPFAFETLMAKDDNAARLDRAGVPVILSAGSWEQENWLPSQNIRRLRQEVGIAVSYGLSRARALASITSTPAEAFGLQTQMGTVAVGKRADLVLWSGDPLELSSVAESVWIAGELAPQKNRQRQLVERYLKPKS